MTKSQRGRHAHLRRMRALSSPNWMKRPSWKLKRRRVPTMLGHREVVERWGDGYTEPREAVGSCTCGAFLWEYYQMNGYQYEECTWKQHLADVRKTYRPLLNHGGTK